jgi:hypothetical protein
MNSVKSTSKISVLRLIQPGYVEVDVDPEIASPAHYVAGRTIEPIWVAEDWNLNHHLACALKYIARAGRKHDEIKDLNKAVWYLERRIKRLESQP